MKTTQFEKQITEFQSSLQNAHPIILDAIDNVRTSIAMLQALISDKEKIKIHGDLTESCLNIDFANISIILNPTLPNDYAPLTITLHGPTKSTDISNNILNQNNSK